MPLIENKPLFDALGLSRWHDAGYTHCVGITPENSVIYPNMRGQVIPLWPDEFPLSPTPHPYKTAMVFLEAVPDGILYEVPFQHSITPDKTISGVLMDRVLPWMNKVRPDVGFCSVDLGQGLDPFYEPLKNFFTMFMGVGNYQANHYLPGIDDKHVRGVGAVELFEGKFVPSEYSSEALNVDFCVGGNLYTPATNGMAIFDTGTSFSNDVAAGMVGLVKQFFKQRGHILTDEEVDGFIIGNCHDIHTAGKDFKTGHGVFILPDPHTLDMNRWIKRKVVKLFLGSNIMTVDGVSQTLDQAPYVDPRSGRTVMPLRAPMEAFKHEVIWEPTQPQNITIIE